MASTGLPDGANKHLVAKKLFAEEAGMSTEQFSLKAQVKFQSGDIPVPEGADVQSLAVRVLAYFEKPNSVIEMSPDARAVFTGLQSCFNCQAALLRSEATSEAAREGTGPWFLATLSASNLIFEIGLGILENTEAFRNRQLQLQPRHVLRAYDQVAMARALVRIWTGADLHGESFSDRPLGEEELLTAAEKLDAAMAALPTSSQYQRFALTQEMPPSTDVEAVKEELSAREFLRAKEEGSSSDCEVVCSTPGPVAVVAETPAASDSAAQACKSTAFKDVLTLMDVPSMKHGYGEGGQSVQDPKVGEVLYSDRELMFKTLKRGEAIIFGYRVIDSISVKKRRVDEPGRKYTK
ncbi:unnamed protein product, partial [Symbiodinium sp. CCMP2456]